MWTRFSGLFWAVVCIRRVRRVVSRGFPRWLRDKHLLKRSSCQRHDLHRVRIRRRPAADRAGDGDRRRQGRCGREQRGDSAACRAEDSREGPEHRSAYVFPGFNDAHTHLGSAGQTKLNVDLTGVQSLDEMLAKVKAFADAAPAGHWLTGGNWDHTLVDRERTRRRGRIWTRSPGIIRRFSIGSMGILRS